MNMHAAPGMLPHFNAMQATFYGGQQQGPATNMLTPFPPLVAFVGQSNGAFMTPMGGGNYQAAYPTPTPAPQLNPHQNGMQIWQSCGPPPVPISQNGQVMQNVQACAPLAGNAPPVVGSQNGQVMQNIQAYAPENTQHTQAPPAVGTQNYHAYAPHPEITQQNSNQAHAPTPANITAYAAPHASDTHNSQNFVLAPAPAIGMQNSLSLAPTTGMHHVDANTSPSAIKNCVPAPTPVLPRKSSMQHYAAQQNIENHDEAMRAAAYDLRPPQQLGCFLS